MNVHKKLATVFSFIWYAMILAILWHLTPSWSVLATAAVALLPFPVSSTILFLRHSRDKQQISQLDQALLEQRLGSRTEQLNALQSQINPHFLYNTLDTIRSMALERDQNEIGDIVASLAQMFRYSMDYSNPTVSLAAELAQVDRYMKIQMMRFPGRFEVRREFECDREDLKYVKTAKYSLQPLVENAIAHGFKHKSTDCVLTLRMINLGCRFQIILEDNGAGMEDEMVIDLNRKLHTSHPGNDDPYAAGGIALRNINDRIKLLYSEAYGLRVMSTLGIGTSVVITLPIQVTK